MISFVDQLFELFFSAAFTAIFEVGSIMAILMLVFGILDYRYGEALRKTITNRRLDRPVLMTLLSLIPVDGTLLFQYSLYRRRSIRFGSLTAGIIGIGEEATYLVVSYNPLAWLAIAAIKLATGLLAGGVLNHVSRVEKITASFHAADEEASRDEAVLKADENFHELPDKFRHKLHHFRYHRLGLGYWIFFMVCLSLYLLISLADHVFQFPSDRISALGIPLIKWIAVLGLFMVFMYRTIIRMTTREFGKIYEHEFEDQGDAIGDLAETCSSVIVLIFFMTFLVDALIGFVGLDRIAGLLKGHGLLAILIGALVGLVPGTGASLAFTTLYFKLAGTSGALPFAALLACSMALIGDSQLIGRQIIRRSQSAAHWIAFGLAIVVGLSTYGLTLLLS